MSITERTLYPRFSDYIRKNHQRFQTAVFELKIAKGDSIAFSALRAHQKRALLMASGSGLYHKISDQSMGQKPVDSFLIKEACAYVVITFYRIGSYATYFIPIKAWCEAEESSDKKSMTENECKDIAFISGSL